MNRSNRSQPARTRRSALAAAGWAYALAYFFMLALLCWLLLPAPVRAAGTAQAWSQQTERWINERLLAQFDAGLPLRPEVAVGRFDSRLQLAPCAQVEPFLPPNTRLWGRSRIGLRCTQGPVAWQVFLPIEVRAWGPAWVLRQTVRSGETLSPAHLEQTDIDWAANPNPPLTQTEQWLGQAAARTLLPGQVLRAGMVRAPQVFASGSTVRLLLQGAGFTLQTSGTALNHGVRGEPVRVRLPNRQVVQGIALDAETVLLQP